VVLETVVFGERGRRVVEGEAKVKVLKPETKREKTMEEGQRGAVIISGGSRGIGAAIARELAAVGHPVVVNFVGNGADAETLVREIEGNSGQAIAFQADVTAKRAVDEMVEFALSKFRFLSGVVNNASGRIEPLGFDELSWDAFQRHIDVQIKGSFCMVQAALAHLLARQDGVIVSIASVVADNVPPAKWMPYNVAKGALVTFSRCLAAEYGPKGVRFNCVSPGMTMTDLIADVPEKVKMVTKMQTPLRRLAVPEDIAGTVAFLFSDKARHITGQNIRVCGGIVMA
jgi:3-oxoacyl-[acyl-carrier protein] reductase